MKKTYGEYRGYDRSAAMPPEYFPFSSKERNKGEDLNQILDNVLQDLKNDVPPSVIRCDELPLVHGGREKLSNTFQYIIEFILASPPHAATLFLHIKCEIVRTDLIDMSINSYEKKYKISFHSNSEAEAEDFPEEHFRYCSGSLEGMKGKFSINTEPGTGWLFNLEVPGKLKY